MEPHELRAYCLSRRGAREDFPFGEGVAVYKVAGKMFALMPTDGAVQISLKCDPIWAAMLRQTYAAIIPGPHLNKRHWNGVVVNSSIPDDELREMIDHSYELVVKGLPRAKRETLSKCSEQ